MLGMPIWEQIRSNPEAGAKALVASFSDRLYKLAFRLCSDAALSEDLVIRTLARAVKAQGDFPSEESYFSFLCTILVNLHRDDLRLKAANALVFMDDVPEVEDERPNPGDALSAATRPTFVGAQWSSLNLPIDEYFRVHAAELYGAKPFFYCQHEHPKGTCHGKYSMCSSSGKRHWSLPE